MRQLQNEEKTIVPMKINEKNLSAYSTSASPVDKEGWLFKRGELNKGYQKRWFVLKGNLLFYFDRKGDKEPLGVVILEGCSIGAYGFCVRTPTATEFRPPPLNFVYFQNWPRTTISLVSKSYSTAPTTGATCWVPTARNRWNSG